MAEFIEMKYRDTNCCCCGSDDRESLWSYHHTTKTRKYLWRFQINNVICRKCGHIYVSPVPAEGDLERYYSDSWTRFAGQAVDFDIEKRLEFIEKVRDGEGGAVFVEIGSNVRTDFHVALDNQFSKVVTVEVNTSTDRDYSSMDAADVAGADIVSHYFVLEHISDVASFLSRCRNMLKPDGVMIVEVPNITLYPSNISAQILHEHMNCFSKEALVRAVENCGFELIEVSDELCSRSFGFVAAFRKRDSYSGNSYKNKYKENREIFLRGVVAIEGFRKDLENAWEKIQRYSQKEKKSIIWCANENMLRMLEGKRGIPPHCKVVDSNPEKAAYLEMTPVYTPEKVRQHIDESDYIVILSKPHSKAILRSIKDDYDKSFEDVSVVDYYSS